MCESGNARLREELSDSELVESIHEAQVLLQAYRHLYHTSRSHGALGYHSPAEFGKGDVATQRRVLAGSARSRRCYARNLIQGQRAIV